MMDRETATELVDLRIRLKELEEAPTISVVQLVEQVASQILNRRGEVIDAELALERARNIATALSGFRVTP